MVRKIKPEQVGWDSEDTRPMGEEVEIPERGAGFDAAYLGLGESHPVADGGLGDASSVECVMERMLAGGATDFSHVLCCERVREVCGSPEVWREGGWLKCRLMGLVPACGAECCVVVLGEGDVARLTVCSG